MDIWVSKYILIQHLIINLSIIKYSLCLVKCRVFEDRYAYGSHKLMIISDLSHIQNCLYENKLLTVSTVGLS